MCSSSQQAIWKQSSLPQDAHYSGPPLSIAHFVGDFPCLPVSSYNWLAHALAMYTPVCAAWGSQLLCSLHSKKCAASHHLSATFYLRRSAGSEVWCPHSTWSRRGGCHTKVCWGLWVNAVWVWWLGWWLAMLLGCSQSPSVAPCHSEEPTPLQ